MDDTIAAISTPPGEGGIGIVRLSGENAVNIAKEVYRSKNGKSLDEFPGHTISYGHIVCDGKIIEEVLVTVMRAPRTYTREDVVEINCHSGIVPLRDVLRLVIDSGARLAEPGEFTKRAYLNGRIDLTQAEAVADIIRAKTDSSSREALAQLCGSISGIVERLVQNIEQIVVRVEAAVDFSGEGVSSPPFEELRREIILLLEEITGLRATADAGILLREGVRMSIVGKPNVGKSTLFNALLGRDRVIVTPIPGTTRDVVEEVVDFGGIPVTMADTAGLIGDSDDLIGKEGMKKTEQSLSDAGLVIFVVDGSEPLDNADQNIIDDSMQRRKVTVINKCDLPSCVKPAEVERICGGDGIVIVSAIDGTGVNELKKKIADILWNGKVTAGGDAIVTNVRHLNALEESCEGLRRALESLDESGLEIVAYNLKYALDSLGKIVGKVSNEDILNGIFSQFCIGK